VSNILRAHIALFAVNALYGASHVIAKGIMPNYLTPNVLVFFRILGATALFWLIKLFFVKERVARKDLALLAICGACGVAVNQLLFIHGLSLTSSINTGIIMPLTPILVVILSFFLIKERITWQKSLGILIGAMGAILLTLTAGTGTGDSLLGDLFIIINATSYAVYMVIVKPLMQTYKPLTVITYVFSFGLLYVLLFPPTFIDLMATDFGRIPFDVVLKIVFVIVGVTFLTYLLTVYGLKYLSPSISSAYIYLQPVLVMVFAVLFGMWGIAEDYTGSITWEKVGYMLIIFLGVFLTSSGSFGKGKR
jgi:drug/metabolite transporter (DMT)-like permease